VRDPAAPTLQVAANVISNPLTRPISASRW
jgi:hypothetical protein